MKVAMHKNQDAREEYETGKLRDHDLMPNMVVTQTTVSARYHMNLARYYRNDITGTIEDLTNKRNGFGLTRYVKN
jgi:hypothetical protein